MVNFDSKKILLIKASALGDVMMTTPSIHAVRDTFPNSHISYLVGEQFKDVLNNNPHIDEIISFDYNILLQRRYADCIKLVYSLRKKHFDVVIAFHVHSYINLISYFTAAPLRVGLSNGRKSRLLTHPFDLTGKENIYRSSLYLQMLSNIGINTTSYKMELFLSDEEKSYAQELKKTKFYAANPIIGFFPGGGKNLVTDVKLKRWDMNNFDKLSKYLLKNYPNSNILLFGSKDDDIKICADLDNNSSVHNLIGKTTLREMIVLMSFLDLMVTNDSCSLHFGAALNIPMISLFGPTSISRYAKQDTYHRIMMSSVPCRPCEDVNGKFDLSCQDNICMDQIKPEDVFEFCKDLLGKKL